MGDSSISEFLLVSEPVSSVLLVAFDDGGSFAGGADFLVLPLISLIYFLGPYARDDEKQAL